MNDILILVVFFTGWFILNKFILPKAGIST